MHQRGEAARDACALGSCPHESRLEAPSAVLGCWGASARGEGHQAGRTQQQWLLRSRSESSSRLVLYPEVCSQIRWETISSAGAFDRKIFLSFSSDRFLRQIRNNPERLSWVQLMLKVGSHPSSDSVSFLSVGTAARQSNKSFR